jgi:putative endonuclease
MSGYLSYRTGLEAEAAVERLYLRAGADLAARRWRGTAGEIDLVLREGQVVVFVEVKQSRTHHCAAEHLVPGQMRRICTAASEFLGLQPGGQMTECRFDVALVDGTGRIEVISNAFSA